MNKLSKGAEKDTLKFTKYIKDPVKKMVSDVILDVSGKTSKAIEGEMNILAYVKQ